MGGGNVLWEWTHLFVTLIDILPFSPFQWARKAGYRCNKLQYKYYVLLLFTPTSATLHRQISQVENNPNDNIQGFWKISTYTHRYTHKHFIIFLDATIFAVVARKNMHTLIFILLNINMHLAHIAILCVHVLFVFAGKEVS